MAKLNSSFGLYSRRKEETSCKRDVDPDMNWDDEDKRRNITVMITMAMTVK